MPRLPIDVDRRRGSVVSRIARSPGLWGIVAVVVAAWLILQKGDYSSLSNRFLDRFGFAALSLLVLIHAVVSVSPFPGEVVAVHNSMLLGFALGAACNWCGWMLAAAIQFGLVRRTARDVAPDPVVLARRIPAWLRKLPMDHPLFLIGGRWLPFGGHLVNTAAGVLSVSFRRHLWCSAISIIPVALLFAGIGHGWNAFQVGG